MKSAVRPRRHGLDAESRVHRHAGVVGFAKQALYDGRGRVGRREHAAVGLGLEGDAVRLEPANGVRRLKLVKRPEQLACATRICGHELARVEARVGDVAAPATGDPYLDERLRSALEHVYVALAIRTRAGDRGEETGRAAAGDHYAGDGHGRTLRDATGCCERRDAIALLNRCESG